MTARRSPHRIGTRGSRLAIWQTEWVRRRLHSAGYETDRLELKTTGDLAPDVSLTQLGARAVFTKQIDDALLDGRIDIAVHSFKDLPTRLPDGISIAAIGPREDPRDALVGRAAISWADLPVRGVVATSSLRRKAQLLNLRPDLSVVEIRGNVETRIAKLDRQSTWSATVLAAAGLVRLGLEHRIGERLAPELMLPAPGQGALAVTVRIGDREMEAAVHGAIHDRATALVVRAERAFLRRLEGGCQVPIAAYATLDEGGSPPTLRLRGRVISLNGERRIDGQERAALTSEEEAEALGTRLAEKLLAEGAVEILSEVRSAATPVVSEP